MEIAIGRRSLVWSPLDAPQQRAGDVAVPPREVDSQVRQATVDNATPPPSNGTGIVGMAFWKLTSDLPPARSTQPGGPGLTAQLRRAPKTAAPLIAQGTMEAGGATALGLGAHAIPRRPTGELKGVVS